VCASWRSSGICSSPWPRSGTLRSPQGCVVFSPLDAIQCASESLWRSGKEYFPLATGSEI
jgi:hypothetical protein